MAGFNKSKNELSNPEAQSEVETADSGLQAVTVDVESVSAKTQTETTINAENIAIQTHCKADKSSMNDVGAQTDEINENHFCIGNSDEKFAPLVAKHDGVFKDASGLFAQLTYYV